MNPMDGIRREQEREQNVAAIRDVGRELGSLYAGLTENGVPPHFAATATGMYFAVCVLGSPQRPGEMG